MNNAQNGKQHYDLEEHTFLFAKSVRSFVRKLPRTIGNIEDGKQLINSLVQEATELTNIFGAIIQKSK